LSDVLDRLAAALRAHVDARRRAEERLTAFAFVEPAGRTGTTAPPIDAATRAEVRWFLARALRAAGDPEGLRLLETLRDGPARVDRLSGAWAADGRGRLAFVDLVGELAAAGLVSRELERDEVSLTPLGGAVLVVMAEIERRSRPEPS
jgi:hypothetical protein